MARRMKIAYLVNQYPQPSQSFIRREIRGLEALGFEVARFTLRRYDAPLVDPGDREEQEKTHAILDAGATGIIAAVLWALVAHPLRFMRTAELAWKIGRRSERGLAVNFVYFGEACVLWKRLRGAGVSHVHAHFGTNSTAVAMLCQELGGPPYSFTAHGPEEFDKPISLAMSEKIERAAFVIAISSFGRSQLFRWCHHRCWEKIHVVHCGVDQIFLDQPPAPAPAAERLACVGRLSEQKGQHLLIEAAARLAAAGQIFELVLVGDGPMREEIQARIERLALGSFVRITGFVSNERVREEILASRAMVLGSFAEGLPVVIMEALALGRPVIATAIAGIPELVRNGETGWLVSAGDVDALVTAMREALHTETDYLDQLGRNGAEIVRNRHDAAIEARKLAKLFGAGELAPSPGALMTQLEPAGAGRI
jgi:colanic acid/amylovoran biosynthesis glycosyltransferase